jgi:hypothetical protein
MLCTLKVVNSEGTILAVAPPSRDQLHTEALSVATAPQAMIYQAVLVGEAGQDSQATSVKEVRASILIDTGATQNFVGERYVKRHNLHCFCAPVPLTVALADGKKLVADRMINMKLKFGSHYEYARSVYVLPLGVSADLILGMPWLYSLGSFTCNMVNHEFSFVHKPAYGRSRQVVLKAQPDAPKLKGSKVLKFGQAIHHIRQVKRILKSEQGPTVEQVAAVSKALRQGRTSP